MVMQNPAFGLELGAGIRWRSPERGISGELKGHTLLTHGEEDLQEQSLAFCFPGEPSPSNCGPSLSLNHTMGTPYPPAWMRCIPPQPQQWAAV